MNGMAVDNENVNLTGAFACGTSFLILASTEFSLYENTKNKNNVEARKSLSFKNMIIPFYG